MLHRDLCGISKIFVGEGGWSSGLQLTHPCLPENIKLLRYFFLIM